MREMFGEIWPARVTDGRELYNSFPKDSAGIDEQSFKASGCGRIEEYSKTLVSGRLAALWRERTGTGSPDEWSRKYGCPAECVLSVDDAKSLVDAVANPGGVSAERLQFACGELEKDGAFVDIPTAGKKFLKRVLPARYQKIGISAGELSDWLRSKLGDAPNRWMTAEMIGEEIELCIKERYDAVMRKQAAEKVTMLSDAEAKRLLLELINKIPDAGLSLLE
jgi:hypothetical protein